MVLSSLSPSAKSHQEKSRVQAKTGQIEKAGMPHASQSCRPRTHVCIFPESGGSRKMGFEINENSRVLLS